MPSKTFEELADVEEALISLGGPMAIAAELGIPRSSISGYLNGKQRLAEKHVLKLAEKLGCEPGVLELLQPSTRFAVVSEEAKPAPPIRGDFEGVLKWVVAGWDETTLIQHISRAAEAGRSDVARVLLDFLDVRRKTSQSPSSTSTDDAVSVLKAAEKALQRNPKS